MKLKGRPVYTEATKGPAKTTLRGSTGHFGLGTKNMADISDSREVRTKDALTSPSLIVCYQETTVLTLTNLVGSNRKSSGLYGGWLVEAAHNIYAAKEIPVKESMLKEAQRGTGSALAGNDGLLVVGHRAKIKKIEVLDLLYLPPKVQAEVVQAHFRHNLNGFDDLVFINAHIHNSLVNNQAKAGTVKKVFDLLKDAIIYWKTRFFVGDANMAAYKLVPFLRACGVEARLLDYHVELISAEQLKKPSTNKKEPTNPNELMYDSCVIIAIGGLQYRPKTLYPECHLRMGALVPCSKKNHNTRGYSKSQYLRGSEFQFEHAPPELIQELRKIEIDNVALMETRPHHQVRMWSEDADREQNITYADPSMPKTFDWPLLPDIKGVMAKPWLWDPTGRQWSSNAHWPLYVSIGGDKGRSEEANRMRNEKPAARIGIALHRARSGKIEWETYEHILAEAMQEKNGERSDGLSWAAYAKQYAGKMRAKAERKGGKAEQYVRDAGKAEHQKGGKGGKGKGKGGKGQGEGKGKGWNKSWGKTWVD